MTGQRKLIDAQRWKRVWVNPDCDEDKDIQSCSPSNEANFCWFLLEKVTDGRDTDGQFLRAKDNTDSRLSGELILENHKSIK